MTEPDKNGHLAIEQENAIDLLLQGLTDREVAEQVGVTQICMDCRRPMPSPLANGGDGNNG